MDYYSLFQCRTPLTQSYKSQTLLTWSDKAWADYLYWQYNDRKILKRINKLLEEIKRTKVSITGKPKPLKHHLSGFWAVRINHKDWIIYTIDEKMIIIISCRGRY